MTKQGVQNRIFTYVIIVFGALTSLMPYLYMIVTSTQNNQEILSDGINLKFGDMLLKNWQAIIARYSYSLIIWNSTVTAVISTVLATASSTMTSYALAKHHFMRNKLLFNTVMLLRVVPFSTILTPLFYIMSRLGLSNTYAGVITPSTAGITSVFMMRQYSSQFPIALMEAAGIDGADEWVTFTKIAVPTLSPTIITSGLLILMESRNQYLFPLVMLSGKDKYTVPLIIENMTVSSTGEPINYGAIILILATSVIPMVSTHVRAQPRFKENDIGTANK